ncbi:MAG: PAS domain S-box protein [Thermodesulfobacteriota bacterium]
MNTQNKEKPEDKRSKQLLGMSLQEIDSLPPAEVRCLIQELRTFQIELQLQNEDLRKTQQKLEQARNQFSDLFEHAPVGYLLIDPSGMIHQANQTFAAMVGTESADLRNTPLASRMEGADRDLFLSRFKALFKHPQGKVMELRIKNGRSGWFHARLEARPEPRPETGSESMVHRLMLVVSDISEQKSVERKLRESEARYRLLFDRSSDAVFFHDLEGRFLDVNEVAVQRLGYSREVLLSMSPADIDAPEYAKRVPVRLRELEKYGHCFFETVHVTCSGLRIPVELSSRVLEMDGKQTVLSIARDITERKRREDQLRRDVDRFRLLAENMPVMVTALTRDHRFAFWNHACEGVTGYTRAEMLNHPQALRRLCPDPIQRRCLQPEDKSRRTRLVDEEIVLQAKDGSPRTLLWTDLPAELSYAEGVTWSIGVDITELKRTEQSLRESRENIATTLRSIGDGVITTDVQGAIVTMNPVAETLTGWVETEVRGRPLEQVFRIRNARTGAKVENPVERVLKEGRVVGLANHTVLTARDGTRRQIADSAAPISRKDGPFLGVVMVFRDVTAEYRTREALRESEEQFRSLAESSGDYIMRYDPECRHTYMNPAGLRVSGLSEADILGKTHRESGFPEDLCEFWEEKIRSVFETGRPVHSRFEWESIDGTVYLDWRLTPEFDAEGGVTSVLGVSRDMTEQRRAEAEMHRLTEQNRQFQRLESVGRLAAGVAHDLNNLLSPVLGYADLLLEDLAPESLSHEHAREIHQAALGSRDLVRQLLAFGRKQLLDIRVIDLREVVEDLHSLLRRTIRENIAIETFFAEDPCRVSADAGQIGQVLINLSVNAQDAMPDGGTLSMEVFPAHLDQGYCREHTGAEPGDYVMLAVSDTGCGMDAEVREHIFEPFFTTKEELGTGLGLASVYGIVKQHGGNIWVYSEPGEGTVFKVYLPRVEEDPQTASHDPDAFTRTGGAETILVVEDNAMVRNLACRILKRGGYTVLTAADGGDALRRMEDHPDPIHLLLTDVVMPDMDGKELSRLASERYPGLKVIFMSGYTENVIAHHGVLDTEIRFLQKPFSVDSLTEKVRRTLDDR